MKFKLSSGKGSVSQFYCNGKDYYPGDIVDLPQTYEGVAWLSRVDPVPVIVPPPQKITPVTEAPQVAPALAATVEPVAVATEKVSSAFSVKKKNTASTTA
jgi:hypothetical protein